MTCNQQIDIDVAFSIALWLILWLCMGETICKDIWIKDVDKLSDAIHKNMWYIEPKRKKNNLKILRIVS